MRSSHRTHRQQIKTKTTGKTEEEDTGLEEGDEEEADRGISLTECLEIPWAADLIRVWGAVTPARSPA